MESTEKDHHLLDKVFDKGSYWRNTPKTLEISEDYKYIMGTYSLKGPYKASSVVDYFKEDSFSSPVPLVPCSRHIGNFLKEKYKVIPLYKSKIYRIQIILSLIASLGDINDVKELIVETGV